MNKEEIRFEMIAKRNSFSKEEIFKKSKRAAENFLALLDVENSFTIGAYVDFKNEVSTRKIIESLSASGKKVFLPVTDFEKAELNFAEFISFSDLIDDKHGVLEPNEKNFISPEGIDLFIVPCVAFDKKGYRIGWGKGYYDKFFDTNSISALKIGLAFDFQLVDSLPYDSQDVPLDIIVTESKVHYFSKPLI